MSEIIELDRACDEYGIRLDIDWLNYEMRFYLKETGERLREPGKPLKNVRAEVACDEICKKYNRICYNGRYFKGLD